VLVNTLSQRNKFLENHTIEKQNLHCLSFRWVGMSFFSFTLHCAILFEHHIADTVSFPVKVEEFTVSSFPCSFQQVSRNWRWGPFCSCVSFCSPFLHSLSFCKDLESKFHDRIVCLYQYLTVMWWFSCKCCQTHSTLSSAYKAGSSPELALFSNCLNFLTKLAVL
jgi:hypothetical protein